MKLFWSSRSPYVRKVMVTAHELGLVGRITTERVVVSASNPNLDVMAYNPLAKLPTLVLDDGSALYDSRVICEYLDALHDGPKLHPPAGQARFTALRRQALADGLLDTMLVWLLERIKPAEQQQLALIAACRVKLQSVLSSMERDAAALASDPFGIGQIATGTALSYVDFRFDDERWRDAHPKLAAWHASFAKRPSVTATEHANVY